MYSECGILRKLLGWVSADMGETELGKICSATEKELLLLSSSRVQSSVDHPGQMFAAVSY